MLTTNAGKVFQSLINLLKNILIDSLILNDI